MKKIILSVLSFVFCYNAFAQSDYYTTIKTPTNISIEAIYRVEFSSGYLAQVEAEAANWITTYGSNAVRVAPASRTYNCHNFAWHNSDGGNRIWVNQNDQYGNANLSKYWSGTFPTYQQTTIGNATKAFYSNGDHSAKVISPTLFESKWGPWPRYQHSPTDCPYTSSNLQYYFVPINGDDLICTSKTFSTISISGASYNWTGSKVSISGSGSSITATKTSNGSGWVKTQITSPYSGTIINTELQTIWLGIPNKPTNIFFYPYEPCLNQWVIATVQANNPATSGVHYDWRGTHTYIEQNPSGSEVHFSTLQRFPYTTYVYVKGTNTCGSSFEYLELLSVKDCGGGLPPAPAVVVSPNPASSEITVNIEYDISQDLLTNSKTSFKFENFDISVFNIYGILAFKGKMYSEGTRLNVSNWNKGLYLIKISDGKQTIERTFLVE